MKIEIEVPDELHDDTKALVRDFAEQMATKLRHAEIKYGYGNGWKTEDWEYNCARELRRHLQKGDPRDVAIPLFAWVGGCPAAPYLSTLTI